MEKANVSSLIADLQKPTETEVNKDNGNTPHSPNDYKFEKPAEEPGGGSDFEPSSNNDLKDTGADELTPVITASTARKIADRWTKLFASFMRMGFKPLYRITILNKGDVQKFMEFKRKATEQPDKGQRMLDTALQNPHDPMHPVMVRFDAYSKALEDLPLSAEDMETIAEPLSELIIKYRRLQLGPEWSLALAVGLITLPRMSPMLPDISKIFDAANKKAADS